MRVPIVFLALVATPLLANVSQAQGDSRQNPSAQVKQDERAVTNEGHGVKHEERDEHRAARSGTPGSSHRPTQGAQVSGTVFSDPTFMGVFTATSPGLAGWPVTLTSATLSQSATTGATGAYVFTGVPVGTYTVCVAPPVLGMLQTAPYGGPACATSVGWTVSVTTAGMLVSGVDFGFVKWP